MIVRARAPLRLSFGGGGTDLSPFSDIHGGCIINATIDKYAYATIELTDNNKVELVSADQQIIIEYSLDQTLNSLTNEKLPLHLATYNRFISQYNDNQPIALKLTTYSDVLPGSGLGSSSTLVVAMVKAFTELLNLPLGEYEIAQHAYAIERLEVKFKGGKQDQYAAAFGGFNFIEFQKDRVTVNPLKIKNWIVCELEASLLLFYTGISRASDTIIAEQTKNLETNEAQSMQAMQQLKQDAITMKKSILKGDFKSFGSLLDNSWQAKKLTAKNITNEKLENIYNAAKAAGAKGAKISGAGGGGFMMFYMDPSKRKDVMQALEGFEGSFYNCHFTKKGCEAWRL